MIISPAGYGGKKEENEHEETDSCTAGAGADGGGRLRPGRRSRDDP